MLQSKQVCESKNSCTSPVIFACKCVKPVMFLCEDCVVSHLQKAGSHLFIPLESARELVKRYQISDKYEDSSSKYKSIERDILNYIESLTEFKYKILSFKQDVHQEIEEIVQSNVEKIDHVIDLSYNQLKNLTTINSDSALPEICQTSTMQDIIPIYYNNPTIESDPLHRAISTMIKLYPSFSQSSSQSLLFPTSRYLISPLNFTKSLLLYDTVYLFPKSYDLSSSILYPFSHTSCCILFDGSILVTGGYFNTNFLGDTYIIDILSIQVYKVSDLNIPRNHACLVPYGQSAYIFGGLNGDAITTAERFDPAESRWTLLSNMNKARYDMGYYIHRNRIYLIGGGPNCSIEYFDTNTESFTLIPNVDIPDNGIVAGFVSNRVYVIGKGVIVMDREFREIKRRRFRGRYCSYGNVIGRDASLMFVNGGGRNVCEFDVERLELVHLYKG
jgi:hypothetical protein